MALTICLRVHVKLQQAREQAINTGNLVAVSNTPETEKRCPNKLGARQGKVREGKARQDEVK